VDTGDEKEKLLFIEGEAKNQKKKNTIYRGEPQRRGADMWNTLKGERRFEKVGQTKKGVVDPGGDKGRNRA